MPQFNRRASQLLFGLGLWFSISTNLTAAEQILNGHTFTLPDGFEIEVAAKSPLVDRPITADFDEMGRLYVADSSGSNDPVQKQLEDRTHRIVRLEDTDGDGRFDKSVVFADRMMFPEGTLWHDGSLYVAAPPSIWKLTDTNSDGIADVREEWFQGKTLTGCANDLHGPYLGPDGYIYWAKGAFAEQTYEQPNGTKPLVTKASHIFRRRADGTGFIENVMTGGMDNPVDVVFTPGGERIFTTTFLQNPGNGLRDGLIHAIYGGVYGKVHNVTDFHPRTGDLMPPLVHMGAAAPCGLTRYESDVFGREYENNLFACQFNMYKVSRHNLKVNEATFASTDSDFVVSNNLDFHPTDVLEDADGSLIICDTGGWYKLCCPTSQIGKPDVLGAVYRVRRKGTSKIDDPRGLKLSWDKLSISELTRLLGDARPAVRRRAIRDLAKREPQQVASALKPLLRELDNGRMLTDDEVVDSSKGSSARKASFHSRLNAIWTLTRIDSPIARALVRESLFDSNLVVRQAALHSVSLWRDHNAMPQVSRLLTLCTTQNARLCAEILGRLGDKTAVPVLLSAVDHHSNFVLTRESREFEHAITYALIELADYDQTAKGLESPNTWMRRIAMIALDQMPGPGLKAEQVVPLLTVEDATLRKTALWLVSRHNEWGNAVADQLRLQLSRDGWTTAQQKELRNLLAQFAKTSSVEALIATHAKAGPGKEDSFTLRFMCLHAMMNSGLKEMPQSWMASLASIIESDDDNLKQMTVDTVRSIPLPKTGTEFLTQVLYKLAATPTAPLEMRLSSLAALPAGTGPLDPELFSLLINSIGEESSVAARTAVIDALLKIKLSPEQLAVVAEAIPRVGPLELNRLLVIFDSSMDVTLGLKLVESLKKSPVLTSLRVDAVRQRFAKFPVSVQTEAEALYTSINMEAARQKEKLDELVGQVGHGDVRRGQVVFASPKAACTACHALGYKGGTVGPDLSRIGKIRTERDLLESLLFPSVSFVRSYEPVLIVTKSGQQMNGLIKQESTEEIVITTGANVEARVARADIEEIRPSTVSVMPAGLDTQLTREQLLDLIAFLKSRQ